MTTTRAVLLGMCLGFLVGLPVIVGLLWALS